MGKKRQDSDSDLQIRIKTTRKSSNSLPSPRSSEDMQELHDQIKENNLRGSQDDVTVVIRQNKGSHRFKANRDQKLTKTDLDILKLMNGRDQSNSEPEQDKPTEQIKIEKKPKKLPLDKKQTNDQSKEEENTFISPAMQEIKDKMTTYRPQQSDFFNSDTSHQSEPNILSPNTPPNMRISHQSTFKGVKKLEPFSSSEPNVLSPRSQSKYIEAQKKFISTHDKQNPYNQVRNFDCHPHKNIKIRDDSDGYSSNYKHKHKLHRSKSFDQNDFEAQAFFKQQAQALYKNQMSNYYKQKAEEHREKEAEFHRQKAEEYYGYKFSTGQKVNFNFAPGYKAPPKSDPTSHHQKMPPEQPHFPQKQPMHPRQKIFIDEQQQFGNTAYFTPGCNEQGNPNITARKVGFTSQYPPNYHHKQGAPAYYQDNHFHQTSQSFMKQHQLRMKEKPSSVDNAIKLLNALNGKNCGDKHNDESQFSGDDYNHYGPYHYQD